MAIGSATTRKAIGPTPVQTNGEIRNSTDWVAPTPTAMATPTLPPTGPAPRIVSEPMRSPTTRPSGAMKTTTVSAAIQTATNLTIAQTTLVPPPLTVVDALTETGMVIQTPGILSLTIRHSGPTETATTAATTPAATTQMLSLTTRASGRTAMVMATAITREETTVMPSRAIRRSGAMKTATATATTRTARAAMFVLWSTVNLKNRSVGVALILTLTVLPTRSMPSRTTRSSGRTATVTDTVTTPRCPTATIAWKSLVSPLKRAARDVQTPIWTATPMRTTCSPMTLNSGQTLTGTVTATITIGKTSPRQTPITLVCSSP